MRARTWPCSIMVVQWVGKRAANASRTRRGAPRSGRFAVAQEQAHPALTAPVVDRQLVQRADPRRRLALLHPAEVHRLHRRAATGMAQAQALVAHADHPRLGHVEFAVEDRFGEGLAPGGGGEQGSGGVEGAAAKAS